MRKIISLALVAAMLVCGIVIPATTASATAVLEDNVEAVARYFGGKVVYLENSGSKGDDYEDEVVVKDGAAGTLTIDGVIEEGEWGDVVVHVDSAYAASNKGALGQWIDNFSKNDAVYTHPSAENTYFFGQPKAVNDREFSYDLYFMWDEDFLYVGAHVNDPYNQQNPHTGYECWDGDALQFMVDPQGPNSASAAAGTTYAYHAEHNILHDKSSGTDVVTYANSPWAGAVVGPGGVLFTPVSNFIVAYSGANGGYTEAWDAALRYNPYDEEFNNTNEDGEIFVDHRTKWQTAGIAEGYQDDFWAEQDVGAYATVRPVNHGDVKNPDYTTDYEIAIPWEIVTLANNDGTFQDTYVAEAGAELGITVACLNASKPGNGTYDSWLSWGSGVCGYQLQADYQTAGGSNLLTLSNQSYKNYTACEHVFAEASCVAPETCTKCGYQRGFETGHSYVCTDEVLPTEAENGSVKATCSVCGNVKDLVLSKNTPQRFFGFSDTDSSIDTRMGPSGWTANWYDQLDDASTAEVREGKMLYYKDANGQLRAKTSFDSWTFPGKSVIDAATRGDGLYYVDGTPATFAPEHTGSDGKVIHEMDWGSQTGTYFDAETVGKSFTYKMDIMPTSYSDRNPDSWHVNGFYLWYGKKVVDYMAGLFVIDDTEGTTHYLFAVANSDKCDPCYNDLEKFKANAEVYVEVPESKVKTNEWHQFVAMYDDGAQYTSVYWDGELMVSAHNPQFLYQPGVTPYTLFRRMEIPFYAKNIDYASTAYTGNYISSGEKYTATVNGVAAQYAAGETVTLSATTFYKDDASKCHRFIGWTGVETDNKAESSFVMPAHDVTVDAEYCIVGDITGDGKINAADAVQIKKIIVGTAARVSAADIDNDGKWNAGDASNLKKMVVGKFTPTK